jgi:hypothetical protein
MGADLQCDPSPRFLTRLHARAHTERTCGSRKLVCLFYLSNFIWCYNVIILSPSFPRSLVLALSLYVYLPVSCSFILGSSRISRSDAKPCQSSCAVVGCSRPRDVSSKLQCQESIVWCKKLEQRRSHFVVSWKLFVPRPLLKPARNRRDRGVSIP